MTQFRKWLLLKKDDAKEPGVQVPITDDSRFVDLRNLGAIHGYYRLSLEKGLQEIEKEYASVGPEANGGNGRREGTDTEDQRHSQQAAADEVLRRHANQRLEEIRPIIVERLGIADRQTRFLNGRLVTPGASRFMVWLGGLILTSQALMLSSLLEPLLRSTATTRDKPAPIQDVITLFVVSFTRLHDELGIALPYMKEHDWPWVALGIVFLLSALLIHLRTQDSRIRLDLADLLQVNPSILPEGMGSSRTSPEGQTRGRRRSPRVQLGRAATYVLLLTGTSMLLSTGRSEFMIAATIVGTALTFVTIGLAVIASQSYLGRRGQVDHNLAPSRLEILCLGAPATGLVLLLIPFAALSQDAGPMRAVAYGVITFLLLGGGMMFGVGWAATQAYTNWRYWNSAMNELVARIAFNLQPPPENSREEGQREEKPVPRTPDEQKRLAIVAYQRGYELGQLARDLHPMREDRLAKAPGPQLG